MSSISDEKTIHPALGLADGDEALPLALCWLTDVVSLIDTEQNASCYSYNLHEGSVCWTGHGTGQPTHAEFNINIY